MNPIIEVKNFTKKYKGDFLAVNNISFQVQPGQFHCFIGSNGSGKTTTIKSIINANVEFDGSILINGHLNNSIYAKKLIGYIPETSIFPTNFNVDKFLYGFALLSGYSKEEAKQRKNKVAKDLNIEHLLNKNPNNLSSGQKKKIMLAQCLIDESQVIIMDEPTTNLDPLARKELLEILSDLVKNKKTIFISTHNLSEMSKYADSVTIIEKGHLIYSGETDKQDLEEFYISKLKEYEKQNN
ncbi:ABC transporter ATP-binding protein [Mycoplasma bradburyae]|uniref:ABC transporter ATP-binding protein n=1 Tax=Mycoplasma bradburyae TaxID=2963128 RepID=A0AAW6HRY2_9MOLU|nr:ABC transporter ATP-binding protein [Mycoplasma bradburyae]MDC4163070.1 ABC transporter ATP-binding protein [Mycoplasma bradburyae]MDC4181661.1 ABC transporter ATP-binding protein [Mycoplasma bradburyae]MDC4182388.1 ABC transporter ATP-binding protein [Mycoplasma bradburyae]MDC4183115.1 ABC transporter ATP-binding protein [Mycoplasma bradburyae]MDC4183838.1 ABC transporter ATP-binding protein [Mycoplasma bradburyae]